LFHVLVRKVEKKKSFESQEEKPRTRVENQFL